MQQRTDWGINCDAEANTARSFDFRGTHGEGTIHYFAQLQESSRRALRPSEHPPSLVEKARHSLSNKQNALVRYDFLPAEDKKLQEYTSSQSSTDGSAYFSDRSAPYAVAGLPVDADRELNLKVLLGRSGRRTLFCRTSLQPAGPGSFRPSKILRAGWNRRTAHGRCSASRRTRSTFARAQWASSAWRSSGSGRGQQILNEHSICTHANLSRNNDTHRQSSCWLIRRIKTPRPSLRGKKVAAMPSSARDFTQARCLQALIDDRCHRVLTCFEACDRSCLRSDQLLLRQMLRRQRRRLQPRQRVPQRRRPIRSLRRSCKRSRSRR